MAVLVKDGQSVEVGRPLIQIDPLEATECARSAQAQATKVPLQLEWLLAKTPSAAAPHLLKA